MRSAAIASALLLVACTATSPSVTDVVQRAGVEPPDYVALVAVEPGDRLATTAIVTPEELGAGGGFSADRDADVFLLGYRREDLLVECPTMPSREELARQIELAGPLDPPLVPRWSLKLGSGGATRGDPPVRLTGAWLRSCCAEGARNATISLSLTGCASPLSRCCRPEAQPIPGQACAFQIVPGQCVDFELAFRVTASGPVLADPGHGPDRSVASCTETTDQRGRGVDCRAAACLMSIRRADPAPLRFDVEMLEIEHPDSFDSVDASTLKTGTLREGALLDLAAAAGRVYVLGGEKGRPMIECPTYDAEGRLETPAVSFTIVEAGRDAAPVVLTRKAAPLCTGFLLADPSPDLGAFLSIDSEYDAAAGVDRVHIVRRDRDGEVVSSTSTIAPGQERSRIRHVLNSATTFPIGGEPVIALTLRPRPPATRNDFPGEPLMLFKARTFERFGRRRRFEEIVSINNRHDSDVRHMKLVGPSTLGVIQNIGDLLQYFDLDSTDLVKVDEQFLSRENIDAFEIFALDGPAVAVADTRSITQHDRTELTSERVCVDELAADMAITATHPWPLDRRYLAVALFRRRAQGAPRESLLTLFDTRENRWLPGATPLDRRAPGEAARDDGPVTRIVEDSEGRLWMLLGWSGRLLRVTPRPPER